MWVKSKKGLLLFISITICSLLLSACSDTTSKKNPNTKDEQTDTDSGLKVSYVERNGRFMSKAADIYKDKYNMEIAQTSYPIESAEEYKTKMATAILTGEGPDVILFNEYFPFTYKFIANNTLYDMDVLIKADKEFKLEAYNQSILNCGVYKGERYVIPCAYKFPILYSIQSTLLKGKIKIETDNWNWKQMINIVRSFNENAENKGKYFFSTSFGFGELVKYTGLNIIDYNKRTAHLDSPEFIALLKSYKEVIYPALCPVEVNERYKGNVFEMLKDGTIQMVYTDDLASIYELYGVYSSVKYFTSEEMKIYSLPSATGENYGFSQATNLVAINPNCKKPQDAFNLIKILLDSDLQKKTEENLESTNYSSSYRGAPVNLNVISKDEQYFLSSDADSKGKLNLGDKFKGFDETYFFPAFSLTAGFVDTLNKMTEGLQKCNLPESKVYDFIQEEMECFLSGQKSAEQTAKTMNDKVNLYLNE